MKTLVLVRHAHRDTKDPDADNGLTPKGEKQAEAVARLFKRRFGKKNTLLLSSPKKRCMETLEPLAEGLDAKVGIDQRLLEGGALGRKVQAFAAWWRKEAPELVVACSHGDWIPLFLDRTAGAWVALEKGGWVELVFEKGEARLAFLEQDPD